MLRFLNLLPLAAGSIACLTASSAIAQPATAPVSIVAVYPALSIAAHSSAGPTRVLSWLTKARLVARLTEALRTPGRSASARSMRVAQALQCMPDTASRVVVTPAPSSSGGPGAARPDGTVSMCPA